MVSTGQQPRFVYALIDPFTQEIRYIGQTGRIRFRYYGHTHPRSYYRTRSVYWIRGLLKKGKLPILKILKSGLTLEESDRWEIFYIKKFRARGCRLCNLTDGGRATVGWKPSAETKAKLSATNKRVFGEPSFRKKMSRITRRLMRERPEIREKIRMSTTGFRHSVKSKKKMSRSRLGVKKSLRHAAAIGRSRWVLSWRQVRQILDIFKQKKPPTIYALAKRYKVSPQVICRARNGEYTPLHIKFPKI